VMATARARSASLQMRAPSSHVIGVTATRRTWAHRPPEAPRTTPPLGACRGRPPVASSRHRLPRRLASEARAAVVTRFLPVASTRRPECGAPVKAS
jgi:hypothetical protein